jgi:hypothetical protein
VTYKYSLSHIYAHAKKTASLSIIISAAKEQQQQQQQNFPLLLPLRPSKSDDYDEDDVISHVCAYNTSSDCVY